MAGSPGYRALSSRRLDLGVGMLRVLGEKISLCPMTPEVTAPSADSDV